MTSTERVRGRPLLSLDKRVAGGVLLVVALAFFGGGIVSAVAGILWTLVLVAVAPLLAWMALSIWAERLAVTTEGVFHIRGVGAAQRPLVRDWAAWDDIEHVELVVKRTEGANQQSSKEYSLVFTRRDGEPLKYLVGIPTEKQLSSLRTLCEERGVATSL